LHALLRFLEIIMANGWVASTTHLILFFFMKLIISYLLFNFWIVRHCIFNCHFLYNMVIMYVDI